MKGIYFDGCNAEYREDLPMPARSQGYSLLRILVTAVCNTDKEILKGYRPDFKGVMGHEFVGEVIESDNPLLIGKRVVGEINENCGDCLYCNTNRPHHCSNRKTPGMSRDGCFAEYMTVRDDLLHIVPENLPSEVAVFTEPLAAAFEITDQIDIAPGTPVGIIGDGRLALCIANVMHLIGADVTVIGKHEAKLNMFRKLGNVATEAAPDSFEIVIEASGSPGGILTALETVRKKGTIVLKSTYAQTIELNLSLIPVNEITIVGSRCGPFVPALNSLASGDIVLPEIEIFGMKDFEKAFSSTAFKSGFKPTTE